MFQDPKPLTTLLQSGLGGGLVAESLRQAALKKRIQEALPGALQDQLLGCGLRQGILTLEWSSAAAANLGRFHAPRLMQLLRGTGFLEISEIRTRTRPPSVRPAPPPKPRTPPTEAVISHLTSMTGHMAQDPLRDAFSRLTETLKKKRRKP